MGRECCGQSDFLNPTFRTREQRSALRILFVVNALVFAAEIYGSRLSGSKMLLSDALHLFSHVAIVTVSWIALKRPPVWRAKAALAKGILMFALAVGFFFDVLREAGSHHHLIQAGVLAYFSFFSFCANFLCLAVLFRFRNDDINMESTWVCSRNDFFTTIGMLATSVLLLHTRAHWIDLAVGSLLASFVALSSFSVVRDALRMLARYRDHLAHSLVFEPRSSPNRKTIL